MLDRILSMFATVQNEGHGSVVLVFLIGIVFGSIIQYTKVHKFEKIGGFAMLKDTIVPKMLFLAIGLASIGLYFMIEMGWASYHIKPINLGGLIIGGTIFGAAMAIFGKCPGTGPISVAEGRIDIMVGAIGGILGGAVFTIFYDQFKMIMGPDLGKLTLVDIFKDSPQESVLIFGLVLVLIAILIPLREEIDEDDIGYKE
ncbi:MAG: YeeE/YedE family protein [Epsilonproteobacteria bacterium]|nr:YeeE/YedE family protein [Campylobacterota bacterium]